MYRKQVPRDEALEKLRDERDHAQVQISLLLESADRQDQLKLSELRQTLRDLEQQVVQRERLNRAFQSFG